ncbi:MAG: DUF2889 domain-containing protein [Acidimicrobiales bacterium]
MRRTSNIDSARPDGPEGGLVLTASARDLRTGPDGTASVVGEAALRARTDGRSRLCLLSTHPEMPAAQELMGVVVGPGFRGRVADSGEGGPEAGSLLYLLLDDLPGAALVSGYAVQRAGGFEEDGPRVMPAPAVSRARATLATMGDDRCAGWAHDATMMVTIRERGVVPVSQGPPAPALERSDDPLSWHSMDPLPHHGMRRRRRLDVTAPAGPGEPYRIDAHFRDSHVDDDGTESVLHEYALSATVDHRGERVIELEAEARVLPWMECPQAVASASRVAGMAVGELRTRVRRELVGRSTCTHLNDTLRSLDDLSVLIAELRDGSGKGR